MKYLTEKDRYLIERLLQKKTPVAKIAETIGCCRATVYNEIQRGTYGAKGKLLQDEKRYGYDVGQRIHKENMSRRGRKRKLSADDPFLSDVAVLILNKKYSPEAALYTLPDHKLCVKSIYNYVHADLVDGVRVTNLPYAKPKKNKRYKTKRKGKFSLPIIKYLVNLQDQQQTDHQTVSGDSDSSSPGSPVLPLLCINRYHHLLESNV